VQQPVIPVSEPAPVAAAPEPAPKTSAAKTVAPAVEPPARTVKKFVALPTTQKAQGATVAIPLEGDTGISATAGLANPLNVSASLPAAQVAPPSRPAVPAPPTSTFQGPELIYRTQPTYPQTARLRGISGTVQMEASVDERGNVKGLTIVSGDMALSPSAAQAVASWKYKPATLNGKAIASTVQIQIVFDNRK
jgi:protein TonB